MTHEDIALIKKLYKKNNQDVELLIYIPKLLNYINELESEISNTYLYIDEYIDILDV